VTFHIAALSHKETAETRALFLSVFDHVVSAEQWDWKYGQGPRLGSINLVARTPAGELIGHIGCILFEGLFHQQSVVFAQVCDVMVSRHVRGGLDNLGVYPQLVMAMQKALSARSGDVLAYGFPGLRPFRLGERMGFYRHLYAVQSSRFTQLTADKLAHSTGTLVGSRWNGDRLDALWKRLARLQDKPIVARTGAYLLWRYSAHPERTYRLWILRRFWRDVGWLVTASQPNQEEVIVDCLLPPQITLDKACNLLWRRLQALQQPVDALVHWGEPCNQAIEAIETIRPTGIIATEFQVGNWHTHFQNPQFQPGDTDVF